MKRLLDMGPCACRWPVAEDEDGHFFCGAYTNERPYCMDHAPLAYVPTPKRADRSHGRYYDGRVQGVKATGMDVLHAPVDKLISGSSDTRKFEAPLRMFEPA